MTTVERDFATFQLGDDVYQLADGLIPEIAERLDVEIGVLPTSDELQAIMQKVGTNKVLRENAEIDAINREDMVALVERSGVQKELRRSLWTPRKKATSRNVDAVITMGGVANWQDRTANAIPEEMSHVPVYSIAGNRVMDRPTEVSNTDVLRFRAAFGRYPTEAEYAGSVIVPSLVLGNFSVLYKQKDTDSGDAMLQELFIEEPGLLESKIAVARVANAGVIMALQVREAARALNPGFDSDPNKPQLFVVTDSFPLATNAEQESDSEQFQKPSTALRQVVLTAKKLHEAA